MQTQIKFLHRNRIGFWLSSLTLVALTFLFSNKLHAYGRCFDITGCCPLDYDSKTVSCTIFGCNTCDINQSREDLPCGNCQKTDCEDCKPIASEPCPKPCRTKYYGKRKHPKKKHKARKPAAVVQHAAVVRSKVIETLPSCCEPVKKIRACDKLFEEVIKCKVIFPGDIEDNLCRKFKAKLLTCEPSTCFAPYSQDPSFRTTWEIQGKHGDRCVVSSTYEDIGLRDRRDRPVPVTLTCEYDQVGVRALIKRFDDIDKRYHHFTTCERGVGIHNCTITSNGRPIKKIKLQ